MGGKKCPCCHEGSDTSNESKGPETPQQPRIAMPIPETPSEKARRVLREANDEVFHLSRVLRSPCTVPPEPRKRLTLVQQDLLKEIVELEAAHTNWMINQDDTKLDSSVLETKLKKLWDFKEVFRNKLRDEITRMQLEKAKEEQEQGLELKRRAMEDRVYYLTVEAKGRIGGWVLSLPDSFIEEGDMPRINLRISGHAHCEEEILDLKKQLLQAWQEKLELHKENQRLQATLDRRQSLIDEQQLQIDELLERPARAPKPDTTERYKFEEEGGLLASQRSLNIQHVYASDPEREPKTKLVADSHARSTRNRVSKRRHKDKETKKKKVPSKRAEEQLLAAATKFELEISDLEDSQFRQEVTEMTDRFAKQVLSDPVDLAADQAAPAPGPAPTPTTGVASTGSSNAGRVILPLPSRKKARPQGSSLVRPLPNEAIGQRTKSNVGGDAAAPLVKRRRDDEEEEDESGREEHGRRKRGRLV
ncbi:hypothetical protein TWF696_001303 [Orbilia brochopaga]|uniref:Uncharacterized protein n=1 Tax=Orbilia brochopaga TaxID=3140254 RepID=A0AAV9U957_9PEZI